LNLKYLITFAEKIHICIAENQLKFATSAVRKRECACEPPSFLAWCSVTVTGKMERYAEQLEGSQERYGLVVDGASLHLIMPVEENKQLLFQVAAAFDGPCS
jgi:hypothetical protein